MADSVAEPGRRVRSGESAAAGGGREDDSFDELRALIVGPEQRELMALQAHVLDPAVQVRDVSRVLPDAIALRSSDPAAHACAGAFDRVGADRLRAA